MADTKPLGGKVLQTPPKPKQTPRGAAALGAGPGRPKGIPNKTTTQLKEAILQAAEDVGQNGEGEDGLVGYLRLLARAEPKAFAGLLGKVLPLQVTGADNGPLQVTIMRFSDADQPE